MLLCGDWVIPVSSPPVPDGAILVEGGEIRDVGPAAELERRYPRAGRREFPGCVLLPGLVNVHTHLDLSVLRGFAPPCGFGQWILRLLMVRRKLDAEDLAASALWGAYECARSGVTTIADTSSEGWTVARAARAAGLRARVYLEVFGLDDSRLPTTMERLEAGLERARREGGAAPAGAGGREAAGPAGRGCEGAGAAAGRGPAAGRSSSAGAAETVTVDARTQAPGPPPAPSAGLPVEWGISPHAPYTVSARLYREAARYARREGLPLATHVAESQAEVKLLAGGRSAISRAYKAAHLWSGGQWSPPRVSPVQHVAGTGALGPDTLVVHAVQTGPLDMATLAASGAAVAHCPRSNLRLQCGMAPVAEMLSAGLRVGLGTDGLCSNDDLDMFAEMRAALEVSEARAAAHGAAGGNGPPAGAGAARAPGPPPATAPPVSLTPAAVLRMATLEGARALGQDGLVGCLAPGRRADVIAVHLPGTTSAAGSPTATDPIAKLVACATAADVIMTMVDGAVVAEGGSPPVDVAERHAAIRSRLGLAD